VFVAVDFAQVLVVRVAGLVALDVVVIRLVLPVDVLAAVYHDHPLGDVVALLYHDYRPPDVVEGHAVVEQTYQ